MCLDLFKEDINLHSHVASDTIRFFNFSKMQIFSNNTNTMYIGETSTISVSKTSLINTDFLEQTIIRK